MLLKVNPKALIRAKVATIEIGRATALISVVRRLPRKMKTARIAKERAQDQVLLHLGDGAPDEDGLVDGDAQVHPRRECLVDLLDLFPDCIDDGHGVRPGLLLNAHRHGRDAIEAGDAAPLLHPVFHLPDVPEADRGALVVGDDQVVEIGDVEELPLDLDRVLLGEALDPPPRQLDVSAAGGRP